MYKYCICADEDNGQGDESSCEDAATCAITPESTVDIDCGDLFSGTVTEGEEITISAPPGGTLPDDITCTLGPSGGDLCQTVTINTSGDVDLQLKDKFGSLELVSCDENDCFTDVTYVYDLVNVGEIDMTINKADITFKENAPVSILDMFPTLVLAPTESTSVTDQQTIDICISDTCVTCLEVDANTPSGNICEDKDTYTLEILIPPTPPVRCLFIQLVS